MFRLPGHVLRASAAGLTSLLLGATLAGPASALAPEGPALFGVQVPRYDGVYRHAFAILALDSVGATPSPQALDWLTEQQCADGGWMEGPLEVTPCVPSNENVDATALAVMALKAVDREPAHEATSWLRSTQNDDGGWRYFAHDTTPSNANSTGLAMSALAATGIKPDTVAVNGKSGQDLDCFVAARMCGNIRKAGSVRLHQLGLRPQDAGAKGGAGSKRHGNFSGQMGMLGQSLPVIPSAAAVAPAVSCADNGTLSPQQSARWAADFLAARIAGNPAGAFIPASFSVLGTTAQAVLALQAAGTGHAQAEAAGTYLSAHVDEYVKDTNGADHPGALAMLILVAKALGQDPKAFGGSDLVTRLAATGPAGTVLPATNTGASGPGGSNGVSNTGATGTTGTTGTSGTTDDNDATGARTAQLPATGASALPDLVLAGLAAILAGLAAIGYPGLHAARAQRHARTQ